jgi:hypothetical protein
MAACEDGRSIVTGTRRSRNQGEATLAVATASTHTCQSEAMAWTTEASPRRETAECTVSAQKTAMAVQPPNRWVSSNTSWARLRTTGAAHTTTTSASAARA